ncbi:MAG TPA: TetR/AcrR family transcriptional regulator [Gemmatimonadaceae bacterium]
MAPHTGQPDRRVLRTQRALGAALRELMLTKRFDTITVQHVLDLAHVSRSTFYAHYRNTEDLLLSDAEHFFTALDHHFEQSSIGGARVAPVAELLHHVRSVRGFERALGPSGKRTMMFQFMTEHFARTIERRLTALMPDRAAAPAPIQLAARMFAAALMEVLSWWLDRDTSLTPEAVDARYHELVWSGMTAGGRA